MSVRTRGFDIACGLLWTSSIAVAHATPAVEDTLAQRVLACTVCHGAQGRASSDGYQPRIAGKPEGYLYNQLRNFREGRRDYALMTSLLDPLSDEYLREIAQYFAALDLPYPAPQPPTADGRTIDRGRRLVTEGDAGRGIPSCTQCHGTAMTGVAPAIPGLLGLPRDYLNAQMGAWQTGKRKAAEPDCMAQVARALSIDDIGAVSQWLSSQPVPLVAKPAKAAPGPLPLRCSAVDLPSR